MRQSSFIEKLRTWIESKKGDWPQLVTSIGIKWLDEGLHDRGITRDLSWGIPVNAHEWGPNPEGVLPDADALKGKVFYVWFDAPIEYISATWEWAEAKARSEGRDRCDAREWLRWWRGDAASDVRYVQFMGKDNVPFHLVGFPCTIFGINENEAVRTQWKLVDYVKGFNWLNYYGAKFSTSQKRGIFLDNALDLLPADYWRWYLIANAPESSDSSFSWEHFQAIVNKDLADVFGNFVNRVLKFAALHFDRVVPAGDVWTETEQRLIPELAANIRRYTEHFELMQFRRSASDLRAIWAMGNEYLFAAEPWITIKTDRRRTGTCIRFSVNLIRLFGLLSAPIIPVAATRILSALRLPAPAAWPNPDKLAAELQSLPAGCAFDVPEVLFSKVSDSDVADWMGQFGGIPA